jgi:hypothetical protein
MTDPSADDDDDDSSSDDDATMTDPTLDGSTTDPDGSTTDPDGSTTEPEESSSTEPEESSSTDPSAGTEESTTGVPGDCSVVTISTDLVVAGDNVYQLFAPDLLGDPDVDDIIQFEFYAPDTGSFDLSAAPNDNYSMCSQCIVAAEDEGAVLFFQAEGTMDVADDPTDGTFVGSLSGVRLVEVTIDPDTFVSTPVKDGACIEITDGDVASAEPPDVPAEWTCDQDYYGTDDGCDCGCGALDPDCPDMDIDSCEYCANEGSCSATDCPGDIDPMDISTCE